MPDHPLPLNDQHESPAPPASQTRAQSERSGWGLAALTLVPVACCGLPVLLTGVTAAGAGVVIGGSLGVLLLVAAGIVATVAVRRRACPPSSASMTARKR